MHATKITYLQLLTRLIQNKSSFFSNPPHQQSLHKLRNPTNIRSSTSLTRSLQGVLFAQLLKHLRPYAPSRLHPLHHWLLLNTLLPDIQIVHPRPTRLLSWCCG
ncbi:hypothetical protein V8G54_012838 [Vigna mungo]|uniref:Uncharacterized protein n=1 Tax=Vigna mungo TaxID=3915 RepID=A0AAQ3S2R1_VIGMU